jgi:hypothetical protein
MNRRTFLGAGVSAVTALRAQQRRTRNLILVTADGLRWQELFTGIDAKLMNEKEAGMDGAEALRDRLWKPTPEERRQVLMPFFWGKLVPRGVVLGNVSKGSFVEVTNQYRVSYPGYSEILTGRAQDETIRGNDAVQNPTPSILQFVKDQWKLPPEKAAVFASWDRFREICETKPGEIYINAAYQASTLPKGSVRVELMNQLQSEVRFIGNARFDGFTFRLAMEYLKAIRPRLLYLALDETDDYAHDRRYAKVLESIQWFDRALEQLWTWIEREPQYRGATTMILTSDHGRGGELADWHSHGAKIDGAKNIWVAAVGPDTPATGEASGGDKWYQRDIAPTALALLGIDPATYPGVRGRPITVLMNR